MLDADSVGGIWPLCQVPQCVGELVPLSDYGPDGASVIFKAWVCTACRTTIRIDKGEVGEGQKRPQWNTDPAVEVFRGRNRRVS